MVGGDELRRIAESAEKPLHPMQPIIEQALSEFMSGCKTAARNGQRKAHGILERWASDWKEAVTFGNRQSAETAKSLVVDKLQLFNLETLYVKVIERKPGFEKKVNESVLFGRKYVDDLSKPIIDYVLELSVEW